MEKIINDTVNYFPSSLAWSLDGTAIGVIDPTDEWTWDVKTYSIVSGGSMSIQKFPSISKPFLWAHNGSFQVMTMLNQEGVGVTVNVFKVGPAPLDDLVKSYSINLDAHKVINGSISFSPSTYRICITDTEKTLVVLDIQSSRALLQEGGPYYCGSLSPDGSLLVASGTEGKTSLWKYTPSQGYILWGKLPYWGGACYKQGYQFSPTSSSILISSIDYLEVQKLEGLAADPFTEGRPHHGEFSTDGTYVVTASKLGQTITITNLHNNSSQIIDIWFGLHALVLTGSILLVQGADMIVAWRLTVDGTVDGVLGIRRADCSDSLWTKPLQEGGDAKFCVEGQIGVIWDSKDLMHYDVETGEKLEVVPGHISPTYDFKSFVDQVGPSFEEYSFSWCHFTHHDYSTKDNTIPYYKDGWVKYPEGEHSHRLWLPVHWRPIWNGLDSELEWSDGYWVNHVMTLLLDTSFGLAIIKFWFKSPPP